jgi:hypothetical protein
MPRAMRISQEQVTALVRDGAGALIKQETDFLA